MDRRRPEEVRAWLGRQPSIVELREAYPEECDTIERAIAGHLARDDRTGLEAYVMQIARVASSGRGRARDREAALDAQARRQIAAEALKQENLAAAAGVREGRVRFNLVNGYVAQKLLFAHDLERKPVSNGWFRLLWPVLWQRRLLMPLVAGKGIYCFYSKSLVTSLAAMIGDRPSLEIAAGDGTLSRFLADAGVDIVATDDHSWDHVVRFGDMVAREDARTALRTRRPRVVLCSWPPAGNDFERAVFSTPSVELYVVIGSRHRFASGNWTDYDRQTAFSREHDTRLSRLVLPPELEPAVHVFRRVAADRADPTAGG